MRVLSVLEYEKRCHNCQTIFITDRPKAKYCGQVCAGEGTQAHLKMKASNKDYEYLQWLETSASARNLLSKPWKMRP